MINNLIITLNNHDDLIYNHLKNLLLKYSKENKLSIGFIQDIKLDNGKVLKYAVVIYDVNYNQIKYIEYVVNELDTLIINVQENK